MVAPLKMSAAEYEAMLAAQGGRCAICGKKPGKIRLARDHDHVTGRIRGLLHGRCNRCLAPFEYDVETLRRLIEYCRLIIEDRQKAEKKGN